MADDLNSSSRVRLSARVRGTCRVRVSTRVRGTCTLRVSARLRGELLREGLGLCMHSSVSARLKGELGLVPGLGIELGVVL